MAVYLHLGASDVLDIPSVASVAFAFRHVAALELIKICFKMVQDLVRFMFRFEHKALFLKMSLALGKPTVWSHWGMHMIWCGTHMRWSILL